MIDIEVNIKEFINGRGKNQGRNPDERYASFDYCFNHFQSFRESGKIDEIANEKNLQQSCLQLGFYLASWGMLRGASFLLEKSVRHYASVIEIISKFDKHVWDIDVDSYNEENIKLLLNCKDRIIHALGESNAKTWDTLATKIMLGIFGNIPAYDRNFKIFLRKINVCQTLNKKSLLGIKEFYKDTDGHAKVIDRYNKTIYTYDFISGEETKRNYTKAKIIDMIGFVEGQKIK